MRLVITSSSKNSIYVSNSIKEGPKLAPLYFEIRRPKDEVTGILRDKKDFDF
jgi:hypothetical protein